MIPRSVSVLALTALLGACAGIGQKDAIDSQAGKPVRVCTEERGCNSVSRADLRKERMPEPPTQEEARIASLEAKAQEDPRAAFDLALRFSGVMAFRVTPTKPSLGCAVRPNAATRRRRWPWAASI